MSKKKQYDYQRIDRRTAQDDWYLQRRREIVSANNTIQKKSESGGIEMSSPGDAHEQQADSIAQKVVNGGDVNLSSILPVTTTVQTKSEGEALTTSPEFANELNGSKGSGQPLDDSTRTEMESKMGTDFSGVKIHTGSAANSLNQQVNAQAFTEGSDIYFNEGKYNPESNQGKELLAHELVHTVQQGNGVSRKVMREKDPELDTPVKQAHYVVMQIFNGKKINLHLLSDKSIRYGAEIIVQQGKYRKEDTPHRRAIAYYFIRNYVTDPNDRNTLIDKDVQENVLDYLPVELLNTTDFGFNQVADEQRKAQVDTAVTALKINPDTMQQILLLLNLDEAWLFPEVLVAIKILMHSMGADMTTNASILAIRATKKNLSPKIDDIFSKPDNWITGTEAGNAIISLLNQNFVWNRPSLLYLIILDAKILGIENNPGVRQAIDTRDFISPEAQHVLKQFNYEDGEFNLFPQILALLKDQETWDDTNLLDITITMIQQMNMEHDPAILTELQSHKSISPEAKAVLDKHGFTGTMFLNKDVMAGKMAFGGKGMFDRKSMPRSFLLARRKKLGKGRFPLILEALGILQKATMRDFNLDFLQQSTGENMYGMEFMNGAEFSQSDMAKGWLGNAQDIVPHDYIDQAGLIQEITHDRKNNVMIVKARFLPFAGLNMIWGDMTVRTGNGYFKDVVLTYNWNSTKTKDARGNKGVDIVDDISISIGAIRMSDLQYITTGEIYGIGDIESNNIEAVLKQQHSGTRAENPDKLTGAQAVLKNSITDLSKAFTYTVMGNVNKFMPDVQPGANAALLASLNKYTFIQNWALHTGKTKVKNVISSTYGLLVKEVSVDSLEFFLRPQMSQGKPTGKFVYGIDFRNLNLETGKDTDKMVSDAASNAVGNDTQIIIKGLARHAKEVTAEGIIGADGVETLLVSVTQFRIDTIMAEPFDLQTKTIGIYSDYAGLSDLLADFQLTFDYTKMGKKGTWQEALQTIKLENASISKAYLANLKVTYNGILDVKASTDKPITITDLKLAKLNANKKTGQLKLITAEGIVGGLVNEDDITIALQGIVSGSLKAGHADSLSFNFADGKFSKLAAVSVYYAGSFDIDSAILPKGIKAGTVSFVLDCKNFSMERVGENYVFKNVHFSEIKSTVISLKALGQKIKAEDATITNLNADFTVQYKQGALKGVALDNVHIDKLSGKNLQVGEYLVSKKDRVASISDIYISGFGFGKKDNHWEFIRTADTGSVSTGKIDIPKFSSSFLKETILTDYNFSATGFEMTEDQTGTKHFILKNPDFTLLAKDDYSESTTKWFVSNVAKKGGIIGADEIVVDITPDKTITGHIKNPTISNFNIFTISETPGKLYDNIKGNVKIEGNLNFRKGKSKFALYESDAQYEKVQAEDSLIISSNGPIKITSLEYDKNQKPKEDPVQKKIDMGITGPLPLTYQNKDSVNYFDFLDTANGQISIRLFGNSHGGPIVLSVKEGMLKIGPDVNAKIGDIMQDYIASVPDSNIPAIIKSVIGNVFKMQASINAALSYLNINIDLVNMIFVYPWAANVATGIHNKHGMRAIGDLARIYCANTLKITDHYDKLLYLAGYPLNNAGTGPAPAPKITDLWFKIALMEKLPEFYSKNGSQFDLKLSRMLNYQYLQNEEDERKGGAEDQDNLTYLKVKEEVKGQDANQFSLTLFHQLFVILDHAAAVLNTYITNPLGSHADFTRQVDTDRLMNLIAAWSSELFTNLLTNNLAMTILLNDLKFTEDTGKFASHLIKKDQGTVGLSDVKAWRDAKGSIDLNMESLSSFKLNKMVIPGFAYLSGDAKTKINVGTTTIGPKASMQTSSSTSGRNQKLNIPDTSVEGLKIEMKLNNKNK